MSCSMKYEMGYTKKSDEDRNWKKGNSLNANINQTYEGASQEDPDESEVILTFLTSDDYEGREKVEKILERMIVEKKYWEIIHIAREALIKLGVSGAQEIALTTPAAAVAFAEAVNLSAKTYNSNMYTLKPAVIVAAWKVGATFGVGEDDAHYLFDPYVGTASFHNPDGSIEYIVENKLGEKVPEWQYKWSGVTRQYEAFDVLRDFKSGEGVIPPLRDSTTPYYLSRASSEYDMIKKEETEKEPVLYSAHFVDNPDDLKKQFPPVHVQQYYDHCTIEFQPEDGRTGVYVGEKSILKIIGRVTTDRVDALVVVDSKSKNKNPHITLSVAEGVRPSESNAEIMRAMEEGTIESVSGEVSVTEGCHNGSYVVLTKEYKDSDDK